MTKEARLTKFLRILFTPVKWIIGALILIEILSFLALTITNYVFYGHAREGSRAVYDSYTLFLQSAGVRPTAFGSVSRDPKKNRVIWMFGGSTMRGATDFDDRTIPSFVAQYLNSRESGLHYTVINYGMNSFNSLLEVKYLEKQLIESDSNPDVIIFYDGANDAKYFAEHRDPYGHHGYRRSKALIESYYKSPIGLLKPLSAAIYSSFTKELYDKINQVAVPIEKGSPSLAAMVVADLKRYDFVNKVSGCYGARFILYWQPMLWVEDCNVSEAVREHEKNLILNSDRFKTVRHNFTVPYVALAERLGSKPYFVSLNGALCGRTVPVYQPDGVHLTDEGRKIVGLKIGKDLEKRLAQ
jgi:hypothetical protein